MAIVGKHVNVHMIHDETCHEGWAQIGSWPSLHELKCMFGMKGKQMKDVLSCIDMHESTQLSSTAYAYSPSCYY